MKKILLFCGCQLSLALSFAQKEGDEAVIAKLKDEGLQRSQVMQTAFYLTDVNGPRLTASPGFMNAAQWAKGKLESWGLKNVQIESWGEFGKGWQQERCYVAMTKPYYVPLMAQPKAWTGSTTKLTTADVVLIKAKDSAELMQYAGKVKDKIVMMWSGDTVKMGFKADAGRHTDEALDKMAKAEPQAPRQGGRPQGAPGAMQNFQSRQAFTPCADGFFCNRKACPDTEHRPGQ